jgi:HSP20 family protein
MSTITKEQKLNNLFDLFFEHPTLNKPAKISPALNAKESEKEYHLEFELPGFNKNDIEVTLENNQLVVTANQKVENETSDKKWLKREIRTGHYERRISLPENIDTSAITAESKDGILSIVVPKINIADKVKKISVQG